MYEYYSKVTKLNHHIRHRLLFCLSHLQMQKQIENGDLLTSSKQLICRTIDDFADTSLSKLHSTDLRCLTNFIGNSLFMC
jgi:hypothetical protein